MTTMTNKTVRQNKTGFKGVTKKGNKYAAAISIRLGGERYYKYIGSYTTAKLAYTARCEYIDSLK